MTATPAELYPVMCDVGRSALCETQFEEVQAIRSLNEDGTQRPSVISEENPPGLSSAIARSTGARKELI